LLEEEIKKINFEYKKAEKEGNTKLALKKLKDYSELSKQKSKLLML